MKNLFTTFKIGSLTLANRFFMAPLSLAQVDENGAYTKGAIAFYKARAQGGVGLVMTGANEVGSDDASLTEREWPAPLKKPLAYLESAQKLTATVHESNCRIMAQLAVGLHSESYQSANSLSKLEIDKIISEFVKAAEVVKQAGFDGVEIHTGHLLNGFTLRALNKRSDAYGGSLENRWRIIIEIVEAIKVACGKDFPLLLRLSAKSCRKRIDQEGLWLEEFSEWGRSLEESLVAARFLEEAGVDGFDVTAGVDLERAASYWQYPPVYFEPGSYLKFAKALKAVVSVPVMVAGKMNDWQLADKALKDGVLDAVGLGRPLLADPKYPNKLKNDQNDLIRPCLFCNDGCLAEKAANRLPSCTVNYCCNRELEEALRPADKKKVVLVVGGGVAGLEAARVCAIRGHNVTLWEKSSVLGGMLKYSSQRILKSEDHDLIFWYQKNLEELGVSIILNNEATVAKIKELRPDSVILATGSQEKAFAFKGEANKKVTTAIDVLSDKTYVGPRCLTIGGGLSGCETALHLAMHRHKITIAEKKAEVLSAGITLAKVNRQLLIDLLNFYKVRILTLAKLKEVTETGAVIETPGQEEEISVHHVILANGFVPLKFELETLKDAGYKLYKIGDGQKIGNIRTAIQAAYELANRI